MALAAKISRESDHILQELVVQTGKSKIEIINEALKSYRFRKKMQLLNQEYEKIRSNQEMWNQELEERTEIEDLLLDGFEEYGNTT